jgi:hypothetical protein
MTYLDEARAIGPRPVWQITPPSDYRDRMAQDGAPQTPPGGYPLTDHGGSTISTPKLVLITLGQWWGDVTKLQAFAQDLMTAGYLQPLADYKYGSGQGSFAGLFSGAAVAGTVQGSDLQAALTQLIDGGKVPAPDANTLYALLLPEGVTVQQGGSASCSAFCGYHDAFTHGNATVYYTVQTATDCQGCNEGDPFAAFTAVLAHEVAEACTDAIPGGAGTQTKTAWRTVMSGRGSSSPTARGRSRATRSTASATPRPSSSTPNRASQGRTPIRSRGPSRCRNHNHSPTAAPSPTRSSPP